MKWSIRRWSFAFVTVILMGCQVSPASRPTPSHSSHTAIDRSALSGRFFFAAVNPTRGIEETRLYVIPANGSAKPVRITEYTRVAGMIAYAAKQAVGIVNLTNPAGSYLIDVRPGSDYGSTPTIRPFVMLGSTDPYLLTQTVFSPDGLHVAGITSDDRMCIVDAAVQTAPPLCAANKLPCARQIVSWSPDGNNIAFSASLQASRGRCDLQEIFVMDTHTGAVRQLTNVTGERMDANERARHVIPGDPTDHWQGSGHAAWSPDGQWIAFNSVLGVSLIHPDGTNFHVVAQGLHPAWSPNGTLLSYLVARQDPRDQRKYPTTFDMPWDIHVMRPDGSGDVMVTDGSFPLEIQQYVWSR